MVELSVETRSDMTTRYQPSVSKDVSNAIESWAGLAECSPHAMSAWILETVIRLGLVNPDLIEKYGRKTNSTLTSPTRSDESKPDDNAVCRLD